MKDGIPLLLAIAPCGFLESHLRSKNLFVLLEQFEFTFCII